MKIIKIFGVATLLLLTISSCKDAKSYSELLNDEEKAVNSFLAHQRIINEIPADTVFETGENAPYYKIDPDGDVYMQVIKAGDRVNNRAKEGQTIYFRFGRINLLRYELGYDDTPTGNYNDMTAENASFRFSKDETINSMEFGYGLQLPLIYVGIDSEVNILVKSQRGPYSEIQDVVPYLYNIRYFIGKN